MTWYRPIPFSEPTRASLVCDRSSLKPSDEAALILGKAISDWPARAWFAAKQPKYYGEPDDALQNYLMLPIFSERLQLALREARVDGIQYLPVNVRQGRRELAGRFYIANILSVVDALDLECSKISRFGPDWIVPEMAGEISGVMKAVLRAESLSGKDIMRPRGFTVQYYVSSVIKKIFEERRFSGYEFHSVSMT